MSKFNEIAPTGAANLGLSDSQRAALAMKLASGNLAEIHAFGRDIGTAMGTYTDSVLAELQSGELEGMGNKLTTIVATVQSLNIASHSRWRIPLLGRLFNQMRLKKDELMRNFQSVRTQVETLVDEVGMMQQRLAERVASLDQGFAAVQAEHDKLGELIEAGQLALEHISASLEGPGNDTTDQMRMQERRQLQAALDKRVADLRALQFATLQQLPMIRMVQANNHMLIDKFHSIKELTIPAWKRQFALAVAMNEQRQAVKLADTIDNATNDFIRENARILRENTIATAKANQRMVMDVATLREAHESLISTIQEVVRINREGTRHRAQATSELHQLRQNLASHLTGQAPANTDSAGEHA